MSSPRPVPLRLAADAPSAPVTATVKVLPEPQLNVARRTHISVDGVNWTVEGPVPVAARTLAPAWPLAVAPVGPADRLAGGDVVDDPDVDELGGGTGLDVVAVDDVLVDPLLEVPGVVWVGTDVLVGVVGPGLAVPRPIQNATGRPTRETTRAATSSHRRRPDTSRGIG